MPGAPDPLALPAGGLRHSIAVQNLASARDSFGQPQTSWTTVGVVRGSIVAASSRELYAAGRYDAQVTHTVIIRYRADVSVRAGMRLTSSGKVYLVQTVENVAERNRVLKIMCLEQQDGNG